MAWGIVSTRFSASFREGITIEIEGGVPSNDASRPTRWNPAGPLSFQNSVQTGTAFTASPSSSI
jgi:hypothetical protein